MVETLSYIYTLTGPLHKEPFGLKMWMQHKTSSYLMWNILLEFEGWWDFLESIGWSCSLYVSVFYLRMFSLFAFVDFLDYTFFFFEDFNIVSSFIQIAHGKLLDPGSINYPTLARIIYCNISFITIDGFSALRSFVTGQEIVSPKP